MFPLRGLTHRACGHFWMTRIVLKDSRTNEIYSIISEGKSAGILAPRINALRRRGNTFGVLHRRRQVSETFLGEHHRTPRSVLKAAQVGSPAGIAGRGRTLRRANVPLGLHIC